MSWCTRVCGFCQQPEERGREKARRACRHTRTSLTLTLFRLRADKRWAFDGCHEQSAIIIFSLVQHCQQKFIIFDSIELRLFLIDLKTKSRNLILVFRHLYFKIFSSLTSTHCNWGWLNEFWFCFSSGQRSL